jgi:hypothetical protein
VTADDALANAESALQNWSADHMASLVTTAIGLAALRNPLALREALSQAFFPAEARKQLEAFRGQCRLTGAQLRETHDYARDMTHLMAEVQKSVDGIEKRLDALIYGIEQCEARLQRLEVKGVRT